MHDGHRARMRAKLFKNGIDGFHPHEVLEMILYSAHVRGDTNPIAHNLLNKFGSIANVLDASPEDLMTVDGVGESTAALLKLIPGMARLYQESKFEKGVIIQSTETACKFLQAKYIDKINETPSALLMDSKGKVILWSEIGEGVINSASINIRKVVELCLQHRASRVIACHNHPSGIALPSQQDLLTTKSLSNALKIIGVSLLDHIIVAGTDSVSLADTPEYECLFGRGE